MTTEDRIILLERLVIILAAEVLPENVMTDGDKEKTIRFLGHYFLDEDLDHLTNIADQIL